MARTRRLPPSSGSSGGRANPSSSGASGRGNLPYSRPSRTRFGNFLDRIRAIETAGPTGGALILLTLTVLVVLFTFLASIRDKEETSNLGVWIPLISSGNAGKAIEVTPKPKEEGDKRYSYSLRGDTEYLEKFVSNKHHLNSVKTHIRRFNASYENKSVLFQKNERISGKRDNILELKMGKKPGEVSLKVKDLTPYSRSPATTRKFKELGNLYLNPPPDVIYSLTGSHLNLFLDPKFDPKADAADEDQHKRVNVYDYNEHVTAGRITLLGKKGNPLADIRMSDDKKGILVQAMGQQKIYVENNPPDSTAILRDGQLVEISGLFLEARIQKALPLVETSHTGRHPRRRYPFGNLLHIVGPVSLDGSFQSLGIEYMFQEYLMGYPEENIPPGEIYLTIDQGLQSSLMSSIKRLSGRSRFEKASALIMNARTGAILAMAATDPEGYNPSDTSKVLNLLKNKKAHRYNHGCFKRHSVGSVTKPFFAFLGLNLIPDIKRMEVFSPVIRTDAQYKIFGHYMYPKKTIENKVPSNLIDKYQVRNIRFDRYIFQSRNAYQHSLGLLLMAGLTNLQHIKPSWGIEKEDLIRISPQTKPRQGKDYLTIGTLGTSGRNTLALSLDNALVKAVKAVFDIETSSGQNILNDRDLSIYGKELIAITGKLLNKHHPSLEFPEEVFRRRSVVCAPETPRMGLMNIRNTLDASGILFGGRGNMWTDVKLCEAFSRIITRREVKARIVHKFEDTIDKKLIELEKEAPFLDMEALNLEPRTFEKMREVLEKVIIHPAGTAHPILNPMLNEIKKRFLESRSSKEFRLFGKTGTINDASKKFPNSRLFIGNFGQWQGDEPMGDTYTFVVYLKAAVHKDDVLNFVKKSLPGWWNILYRKEGT